MSKSADAFRTISEVSEWLGTPSHVLRFWESRFPQVKPLKRAGGRRYYRPSDMMLLGGIKKLLHDDGITIRGVQKILREKGIKHVASFAPQLDGAETEVAAAMQEEPSVTQAPPLRASATISPFVRPGTPADTAGSAAADRPEDAPEDHPAGAPAPSSDTPVPEKRSDVSPTPDKAEADTTAPAPASGDGDSATTPESAVAWRQTPQPTPEDRHAAALPDDPSDDPTDDPSDTAAVAEPDDMPSAGESVSGQDDGAEAASQDRTPDHPAQDAAPTAPAPGDGAAADHAHDLPQVDADPDDDALMMPRAPVITRLRDLTLMHEAPRGDAQDAMSALYRRLQALRDSIMEREPF
ncbi:MerR family transcriptional regulator [Brevirhabdus sp.]|uniref:MerR family transcriptional regulator n=1 Tax=Brevirhabdus sp. TaxID=2004514 RepID=UPI00405985B6